MDRRPTAHQIPFSSATRWSLLMSLGAISACEGGGGVTGDNGSGDPVEPSGPRVTGSARVTWFAPTTNEDGSPLADLAGFKIYYATSHASLPNTSIEIRNPSAVTWTVANLESGTWFFAVTAFDASGDESRFSNIASKTIS